MWGVNSLQKRLEAHFSLLLFLLCPGFEGSVCGHNVDDCPNHKCLNGGVCVDGVNTYNCRCPPQWTGTFWGGPAQGLWPSPCARGWSQGQMPVQPLKESCWHQNHHNEGQFPHELHFSYGYTL